MKETGKNNLKDKILVLLKDRKAKDIHEIAGALKIEPSLVSYLAEELEKEEFVRLLEITSLDSTLPKDYMVLIKNKGLFLIDIDGGFKRINCKIRMDRTWKVVRIVAGVLNALAIIIIGVCSLFL